MNNRKDLNCLITVSYNPSAKDENDVSIGLVVSKIVLSDGTHKAECVYKEDNAHIHEGIINSITNVVSQLKGNYNIKFNIVGTDSRTRNACNSIVRGFASGETRARAKNNWCYLSSGAPIKYADSYKGMNKALVDHGCRAVFNF